MQDQLDRLARNKKAAWIAIGGTVLVLISAAWQHAISAPDQRDQLICQDMGSLDPKSDAYAAKAMECLKVRLAQPAK